MSHGHVAIGTQLLGLPPGKDGEDGEDAQDGKVAQEPGYPWDEHVPPPGRDATLLAVVPIPGTGTSLAIVGYAISTGQAADQAKGQAKAQAAKQTKADQPDLTAGLLIDRIQRRVWADGTEVPLTFQEFELLAFLSAHPATVFSRADLVTHVWPDSPDRRNVRRDSRTVDVHVSRLRRKLGPVHSRCLVTEHRAGYQFRPRAA